MALPLSPAQKVSVPSATTQPSASNVTTSWVSAFTPRVDVSSLQVGEMVHLRITLPMLEAIYHDFHQELLSLRMPAIQNAYNYLVTERQIDPRVITDSMPGAVPSGGYDVEAKLTPLIEEVEAAMKASEQAQSGKRGRPQRAKGLTPENRLQLITEALEKLRSCILDHAGWLAFFYTDAQYHIVAVRFRTPYSEHFVYFKPYRTVAGLFGHSLFTPYTSGELQALNDLLIVTEVEFNQLQLQSLVARRAEAAGKEPGYLSRLRSWRGDQRRLSDHPPDSSLSYHLL